MTLKSDAHAVAEFLGNRSILSLNECDECNARFATEYEDHLSKWSLFARSVSQVRGKKKRPTFKNPDETLRVGAGEHGLFIHLTDPALTRKLMAESGPYKFTVLADASSQPYVPIRAAKALVKFACSVCPPQELGQCQRAINWLMGAWTFTSRSFSFSTPSPLGRSTSWPARSPCSVARALLTSRTYGARSSLRTTGFSFSSPGARRTMSCSAPAFRGGSPSGIIGPPTSGPTGRSGRRSTDGSTGRGASWCRRRQPPPSTSISPCESIRTSLCRRVDQTLVLLQWTPAGGSRGARERWPAPPAGQIRCRFVFSGKNDEPTPDFDTATPDFDTGFPKLWGAWVGNHPGLPGPRSHIDPAKPPVAEEPLEAGAEQDDVPAQVFFVE